MRCADCGFRIRGKEHEEGFHHILGKKPLDSRGNKVLVHPNPKGHRK